MHLKANGSWNADSMQWMPLLQDLMMTDLCEDFLDSRGYEVLHQPGPFNMMTPNTFILTLGNRWQVFRGLLEVASPVLYLGNDPDGYLQSNG